MARVVISHAMRKRRADIGNFGHSNEKFGKFKYLATDFDRSVPQWRIREKLRVKVSNHGGAGAGRTDDDFRRPKNVHKTLGERLRITPISAIEGRLAATSLLLRKVYI